MLLGERLSSIRSIATVPSGAGEQFANHLAELFRCHVGDSTKSAMNHAAADLPLFLHEDLESGPSEDGQMKRARFTEEQIIGVLKAHEAGAKTGDLARKHGVSEATLYNWKVK